MSLKEAVKQAVREGRLGDAILLLVEDLADGPDSPVTIFIQEDNRHPMELDQVTLHGQGISEAQRMARLRDVYRDHGGLNRGMTDAQVAAQQAVDAAKVLTNNAITDAQVQAAKVATDLADAAQLAANIAAGSPENGQFPRKHGLTAAQISALRMLELARHQTQQARTPAEIAAAKVAMDAALAAKAAADKAASQTPVPVPVPVPVPKGTDINGPTAAQTNAQTQIDAAAVMTAAAIAATGKAVSSTDKAAALKLTQDAKVASDKAVTDKRAADLAAKGD